MPGKPSCCHVAILANVFPPCLWWAERTDENKACELLDGNVISAGASISAAKSPVPMETIGIHDMSL